MFFLFLFFFTYNVNSNVVRGMILYDERQLLMLKRKMEMENKHNKTSLSKWFTDKAGPPDICVSGKTSQCFNPRDEKPRIQNHNINNSNLFSRNSQIKCLFRGVLTTTTFRNFNKSGSHTRGFQIFSAFYFKPLSPHWNNWWTSQNGQSFLELRVLLRRKHLLPPRVGSRASQGGERWIHRWNYQNFISSPHTWQFLSEWETHGDTERNTIPLQPL